MSGACSLCASEEEAERALSARGGVRALLRSAPDGGERALRALALAPPGALLDALAEQLRAGGERRAAALRGLASLAARRPAWAPRLPHHPAAAALLAAARAAPPPDLLHALLALAALLPAAPTLAAPHWPDLAALLLRPALLMPAPKQPLLTHLLLAQRALFLSLYAMYPCSLLEAMRAEIACSPYKEELEESLTPLIMSVRLHPLLIMGSRQAESECTKWTRLEPHDVLAEACQLSMEHDRATSEERSNNIPAVSLPEETAGASLAVSRAGAGSRGASSGGWFSLADRLGVGSAPPTPLPPSESSPPEPAVEATPENTPAKETRDTFRFPTESLAVRALGRSPPPGAGEGTAGRLARVLAERRAAAEAGPEPPLLAAAAPARPLPRPAPRRPAPLLAPALAPASDPRLAPAAPHCPHAPTAPARPRSAPPASPRADVAVQTTHPWPEPYEFIISDFYRQIPKDPIPSQNTPNPSEAVEEALVSGDELTILRATLQFESWRREQHAERNRRLLGRCRAARAAELMNGRLSERVRVLEQERDALRARLRARQERPASRAAPDPAAEEARVVAEAEAAAARLGEQLARAAETQARAQAAAASAALHTLARAAHHADQRAATAARLRRDLLLLAERHQRLLAERELQPPPRPDHSAARARAEQDALAAAARADASLVRAAELEAALAHRDQQLAAMRRSARLQAHEQAARTKALHDKYSCLLRIMRALHTQRILDGEPPPPELCLDAAPEAPLAEAPSSEALSPAASSS